MRLLHTLSYQGKMLDKIISIIFTIDKTNVADWKSLLECEKYQGQRRQRRLFINDTKICTNKYSNLYLASCNISSAYLLDCKNMNFYGFNSRF